MKIFLKMLKANEKWPISKKKNILASGPWNLEKSKNYKKRLGECIFARIVLVRSMLWESSRCSRRDIGLLQGCLSVCMCVCLSVFQCLRVSVCLCVCVWPCVSVTMGCCKGWLSTIDSAHTKATNHSTPSKILLTESCFPFHLLIVTWCLAFDQFLY